MITTFNNNKQSLFFYAETVLEQRVFSLYREDAFATLYLRDKDRCSDELDRTAQQLVGVFLTANENPYIRYSASSRLAKDLAQLVVVELCFFLFLFCFVFKSTFNLNLPCVLLFATQKRFGEVKSGLSGWKPVEDRATFIILDRADDPLTPLLHAMTFQAMSTDLLADRLKKDSKGSKKKKLDEEKSELDELALPADDDKIWAKYRHVFIGEVNKRLPKEFTEWRNESAVNGENMSNSDLMKAAQDMPQYQQQIRRFKNNLDLAQAVTKRFAEQNLLDIILLEQDIACWIDSDGKKCDREKLGARCSKDIFLSQDPPKPLRFTKRIYIYVYTYYKYGKELKLRLFMAYLIAQGGLSDLIRKNLMDQAGFTREDQDTIMNLSTLNVVLSSAKPPKEGHKNSEYWSAVQANAKSKTEQTSEETSPIRFLSYLEWALTNHIENTEGKFEEHFPYGPDKPTGNRARKRQPTSFRKARKPNEEKPPVIYIVHIVLVFVLKKLSFSLIQSGPRVIVYVVGGVTYSELCTCYELSEKHNIDIFIGSTAILTPQSYIQQLSEKRD
ncbi:hypothetical protein RFI_07953 [Reticulomyxa filosa]|uniref:Uncharacterized protein n=1 Tax=Reticulomyxa filosa TaxID=46433 RepID=X6NTS1_RETFI|nr:hypothetical protein RFI_07953 [Reticulomyxa filosa]|eukprot:ETO29174.1 hypothetical protein RFI_07953 [Reticulomyxa filosa]